MDYLLWTLIITTLNSNMGKLRNAFIKLRIKYRQWRERRKLKHTDFTIISNNCWAATAIYQPFGLKYNTPTVGLFIMDEDYIIFLENLRHYLNCGLRFIKPTESKYYSKISNNGKKEIKYPIAILGDDIEIHFMHYNSETEALRKWDRRVKRINFDKLLIKMSFRDNGYDMRLMMSRFSALPFKNKICFVPQTKQPITAPFVEIPELTRLNLVGGDETEYTLRRIDVYKLLNAL